MSGKKPSTVKGFHIVREFRGTSLYLTSTHIGNGYRWIAGKGGAMVISDITDALALSERASREWGIKAFVATTDEAPHIVAKGDGRATYPRAATRMTNCSHGAPSGADCRECRADGVQS